VRRGEFQEERAGKNMKRKIAVLTRGAVRLTCFGTRQKVRGRNFRLRDEAEKKENG